MSCPRPLKPLPSYLQNQAKATRPEADGSLVSDVPNLGLAKRSLVWPADLHVLYAFAESGR